MKEQMYLLEQFDDIKILRYDVPAFEGLSLREKLFVYYLSRAALAWAYRTYLWALPKEARGRYLAAEEHARRAGRGLWAERSPEAPWLWRRRHRTILQRILDFFWRIGRAVRRFFRGGGK